VKIVSQGLILGELQRGWFGLWC